MKYKITPVAAPRMTRRDKWLQPRRKCVQKYFDYRDAIKEAKIKVPCSGSHIIFKIPMPKSWTKKRKALMEHSPHQQTPDKDNLEKALLDSIFKDDSCVWDSRVTKIWAYEGSIEIY